MVESTKPHNYTRPFEVERLKIIRRCLKRMPSKGKNLIELGCNAGAMTEEFAAIYDRVLAIDYDADLVGQASENVHADNIEWLQYDLNEDLSHELDHQFDAAVALEIVEHLRSPEAFVRQIRRFLRPGGSLLISAPNMCSPEAITGRILDARDGLKYMAWDDSHISLFGVGRLIDILRQNGFDISRITGYYYGFVLPRSRRKVRIHWSTSLWPLNRFGFDAIVEAVAN